MHRRRSEYDSGSTSTCATSIAGIEAEEAANDERVQGPINK